MNDNTIDNSLLFAGVAIATTFVGSMIADHCGKKDLSRALLGLGIVGSAGAGLAYLESHRHREKSQYEVLKNNLLLEQENLKHSLRVDFERVKVDEKLRTCNCNGGANK